MDSAITENRNGASWIRDCLVDQRLMAQASDRLNADCKTGIRHFSAIRAAVPLDQASVVERQIARFEDEVAPNEEIRFGMFGSNGRLSL